MFWKKKETVSKAEHDAALALIKALENDVLVYQRKLRVRGGLETADKQIQMERDTIGRKIAIIRDLKAELDIAKESNLKFLEQRDAARAEAEANKVDAEAVKEGGKDEGATYVLSSLASALHVEDWSIQNGSEEWEGDVWATMFRILVDAGVVEEDYHQVATFAEIAVIRAERDELLPDALKHRERLQRDREYHAARRALPA